MADTAASSPGFLQRFGRFGSFALFLLAILASGFAAEMLVNSQALVGSFAKRNTHDLAVIAQILETRQRDFMRIARANYQAGRTSLDLKHPDLGAIHIRYGCNLPWKNHSDRLFPPGRQSDDGDQYRITGEFSPDQWPGATPPGGPTLRPDPPRPDGADAPAERVCFRISVPLQKLISLASTAPDMSNVLIVAPDGTVLEQLGQESLPIAKLPQLEANSALSTAVRASLLVGQSPSPSAAQPQAIELASSAGIAKLTINDQEFRGYIRPFKMTVPRDICRSAATAARTLPAVSPADAASPDAGPGPPGAGEGTGALSTECQLYLVGLIPASSARSLWLAPPKVILVGFGLAVCFVLALLPLVRLLLINNTESVGPIGVLAIVLGLLAAAAIATLALLFVWEVTAERGLAADESRRVATSIARGIGGELGALDRASRACRGDFGPNAAAANVIDASFINPAGNPSGQALSCAAVAQLGHSTVEGRPYFEALKQLPQGEDRYVLDQLVGQTDGLDKTVLARSGLIPRPGPAVQLPDDTRYALRVSAIIHSVIAPTLPPPEKFIVVDTGSDNLHVLFHSRASRAGIENLTDQIDGSARIANQLRHLVAAQQEAKSGDAPVTVFRTRYDGLDSHFAAAPVPGSGWVVLVYYPVDQIDATAAATTVRTLIAWTSLSIIALLIIGLASLLTRRDAWRRLWPFEDAAAEYRRFATQAKILGIAVVLTLICLEAIGPNPFLNFMPVIAMVVPAAFAVHVFVRLGTKTLDARPLSPGTEQAYLRFVLGMLACAGVAPTMVFWTDARGLSRAEVDISRSMAAGREINEFARRNNALAAVLADRWKFQSRFVAAPIKGERESGLTATMLALESGAAPAAFDHCPAATGADATRAWFCTQGDRVGVVARPLTPPTLDAWVLIVIFAGALLALLHVLVAAGLEALTGFGIPLGAVTWPKLVIGGTADPEKNELKLAKKSLLVAPQQAVRDRLDLLPRALSVNLSDQLLPAPDDMLKSDGKSPPAVPTPWKGMTQAPLPVKVSLPPMARLRATWGGIFGSAAGSAGAAGPGPAVTQPAAALLIVSGLELVLRDALRRRAALAYLERAASVLSVNGQTELAGLVIIAEMAPLERILDAFESFAENDQQRLSTREELRWARLFQDFSTFYFAPIDKVDKALLPAALSAPTRALIEELRWLPGAVIDGVIADHSSREALTQAKPDGDQSFPLPAEAYRRHYTPLIAQWANSLDARTTEAAVDYMRANLIEYYEQCWAASSFAERVILDAIARRSFINMRKAVALQSLVRRGLLILDPAPRLMNQSFALYLRQGERPDTLAKWKAAQPRSTWSAARLPLALLLPASLLLLAVGTAESGQTLGTLFPLLAAGLPAVVSLLIRSAKPA